MVQLVGDVKNRVKRLPKPSNVADGLQPIFEAVSNAMHAIYDLHGENSDKHGEVIVDFAGIKNSSTYTVHISDNGVGLEPKRFAAFCTTDTNFKIDRGGKGVGRLLWLDAFSVIHVESIYRVAGELKKRIFDFGLSGDEPIYNDSEETVKGDAPTGTSISMMGV